MKNLKLEKIKVVATPLFGRKEFEIDVEKVTKVYKGELDCCRCGCGGDYFEPLTSNGNESRAFKNALEILKTSDKIRYHEYDDENIFEIVTNEDRDLGITIYVKK